MDITRAFEAFIARSNRVRGTMVVAGDMLQRNWIARITLGKFAGRLALAQSETRGVVWVRILRPPPNLMLALTDSVLTLRRSDSTFDSCRERHARLAQREEARHLKRRQ